MPTVSVLVPAYQAKSYIAIAIESVLAQTFQDFELIVVDDASIDDTYDIALRYAQHDQRIHVERNTANLGMAGNWNRCLALASGAYIIKLDADDAFLPEVLAREVALLNDQPDVGLVCTYIIPVSSDGEPMNSTLGDTPPWFAQTSSVDGVTLLEWIVRRGNFICSSSVMLRRELVERHGSFDETITYTTDLEMWLRMACHARLACIAEPLVRYRVHHHNQTTLVHATHSGVWYTAAALLRAVEYYAEQGRIESGDAATKGRQVLTRMADRYATQLIERDAHILKQRADALELQGMVAARNEQLSKDVNDIAYLQALAAAGDEQRQKDAADIAQLQALVLVGEQQRAKDARDIAEMQVGIIVRDAQLVKDAQDIAEMQTGIVARDAQLVKDAQDIVLLQHSIQERDVQNVQLQAVIDKYGAQLAKNAHDIAMLIDELHQFKGSIGGRIVMRAWQLRQRVLPSGSAAARGGRLAIRTARMIRQEGPGATLRHGAVWLRYHRDRLRGTLPIPQPANVPDTALTPATFADAYRAWQGEYEPSLAELQQQRDHAHSISEQPLVSLVVLIDAVTPAALRATLASIHAQTYANWECWLVISVVAEPVLRAAIVPVVPNDERVHVLTVDETHAPEQVNSALAQLGGAWTGVVSAGDQLAPHSLFACVTELNRQPTTDIIYSDSDHLDAAGRRFAPLFKPDWSPALLLSLDYLADFGLMRTTVIREIGGAETGAASAWLRDLGLRLSERTQAIVHVPQVLYHHAGLPNSAEMTPNQEAAVIRSLARQGLEAELVPHERVTKVRWPLAAEPLVSIIIPSRNVQLVDRCLRSIKSHTNYHNIEFVVIDTSQQGTIAAHYQTNSIIEPMVLRYTEPFNYSLVNNIAAQQASGELLLFLNDDIEVFEPDWLHEMVRWALREEVGVVGAQLLRADGSLQHAGVVIGLQGFAGHPFDASPIAEQTIFGSAEWYRNYNAVTGACLLIKRKLFEQTGGFDQDMVLCGSDVELCLRAREAGYQVVYTPFARLYHLESATRTSSPIPSMDFAYSYVSYLPLLQTGDPFFNINLSAWSSLPAFRTPNEPQALEHVRASLRFLGIEAQTDTLVQERAK